MPRNRVSYPAEFVLCGPSPSSGMHFMSYLGVLNNTHTNLVQNHNLLRQINRVQNVSFSLAPTRTEVKQLGKRNLVDYPNVLEPNIQLSFDYLLNGLGNDARIGLNVNHAQWQYPHSGGTPKYANNYTVNLLSGLMGRQLTQPTSDPYFPLAMRDNRNIFLVRCAESDRMMRHGKEILTEPDFTQNGVDLGVTGFEVFAFGNCYLDSYKTQAAINSFPMASTSWTCENAVFYTSGSGCNIPAINTQTRQTVNSNKFVIPQLFNEGGPSILNPGDITLDISSFHSFSDWGNLTAMTASGDWEDLTAETSNADWGPLNGNIQPGNNMSGLGINFNDVAITNYQISMNFRRDALSSLAYKVPLDRQISFPVFVDLTFGMTVGDSSSGSFIDLLNRDVPYNLTIKLKNPDCNRCNPYTNTNPRHDGPVFTGTNHIAAQYDWRGARFMGIEYSTSIGENKSARLSFRGEIVPEVVEAGFWISGLLNLERLHDSLVDENGNFVIDENSQPIVTNLIPLF